MIEQLQTLYMPFFIEAFWTAVLVFVMLVLTSQRNPLRGAAIPPVIGATYGIMVPTLGGLTG
jgi:glycerol uptake facilitator-like aquaporin